MNISEPFLRRPVMTTLVMTAILAFGIVSYLGLPISDLPSIEFPTIVVTGDNPGADAQTMAANVATPIEKQLMAIPGLRTLLSQNIAGTSTIVCTFDLEMEIMDASTQVAAALTRAAGQLPSEMPDPPYYERYNPTAAPIIYLAVESAGMTMADLYDYANTAVAQRISMTEGVSQVQVYGAKRAVTINVDPDALFNRGIGLNQLAASLRQANQLLPAGTISNEMEQVTLEPMGQLENAQAFNDLIVAYREQGPVRVSDIGYAENSTQTQNLWVDYWKRGVGGHQSVVIAVMRAAGANTVQVTEEIKALLPEISKGIPASIELSVIYDRSETIKEAVNDVKLTLLIAFFLVVLVIFLFLGNLFSTIAPLLALPMSIIGTFAMMNVLGYSIDILSMMALTLVIGFLVDDAIVVLENHVRHLDMDKTPMLAASDSSRQISTTVLSMTLSLGAVFIPFIFMPGIVGRLFHEFAMVTVVAVLLSGFISLSLTPLVCAKLVHKTRKKTVIERFSDRVMGSFKGIYEPALTFCLHHGWIPVGGAALAFIAALFLFSEVPQDFLPSGDTGAIEGITVAAEGTAPDQMIALQRASTELIQKNPAVDRVISIANAAGVGPPNQGMFYVMLKPESERPAIEKVSRELMKATSQVVGLQTLLRPFPEINLNVGTNAARANYTYALSTMADPKTLYASAQALLQRLEQIPELASVSSDAATSNPQLQIEILRDQATTYGISAHTIEEAFSLAYAGGQLDQFSTPVDTYRVILQFAGNFSTNVNALNRIWLAPENAPPNTNTLVPLRSVADWKLTTGPLVVNHVNQFTSATLFFNTAPGVALGPALQKVNEAADELLPPSIIRQMLGQAQIFQQTIPALISLMIVGVAVIYLLLGVLYESFIHPLTILSALPGALFGALMTLAIFGATLSLYSYVGMIVLVGIVMKNGIMLVEFAKDLIDEDKGAFEAIREAALTRFRPILMTTVAAAMGAVPVALGFGSGAASRRPLGLVIVGGLLFAQLITYFFTPVIFFWLEQIQEWNRDRRKAKEART